MKNINVLENIKADNVVSITVDVGAISGNHLLLVDTINKGEIQHPLTNGFEIHYSNEFLRSLNLEPAELIGFSTYPIYRQTVQHLNTLLAIRKAMEAVTGKSYSEIGILASQIYDVVLNRLLAKYNLAYKGYENAIQERPVEDWIREAIAYFK